MEQLAESIIYLCSLIADQPRAIDRHIDYFGDGSARRTRPGPPCVTNGARSASEGHERYERPGHGQGAAAAVGASGPVPRLRQVWASVARSSIGGITQESFLDCCTASFGR